MPRNIDLQSQVQELRNQGLSDSIIMEELKSSGFSPDQINQALMPGNNFSSPGFPASPGMSMPTAPAAPYSDNSSYDRLEEIAENIIDEKWDQLIGEVKKIIDWKESMESELLKLQNDVTTLKDNFKLLHQGVLGKLEDYDNRMREVGTELNAVGKVFKEVIPEFVDNVKELKSMTKGKKLN